MSYYRYGGILVNESTGNSIVADVPLKNLFNPSVGEVGFIEPSTGVVNPAQAQCYTTDFIPVEVGKTVAIGFIHKYVWNPTIISDFREYGRYTFFKADKKTVVNGGDFGYSETMHGVVVPSGASYIRASWATYGGSLYFYPVTDTWKCFVTCGDTLPTNPVPYKYNNSNVVELDSLPLFGKTLLVFGDSYSDSWGGHSWDAREITQADQGGTVENNVAWSGKLFWSKVCSEFGLTIDNRATGGSNLPYGSSSYETYNGMDKIKNLVTEVRDGAEPPKFLVLQYGTNCWESQVGTVNDSPSESASTYPSAIKWAIDTIKSEMPNTKIGVLLPLTCNNNPHRFNAHDVLLEVMQTEVYKDVPFVDMAEVSGLVLADLPDGVHPASEKANKTYANWCRVLLMKMIM